MPSVDLTAAWVPIHLEPGDAVSIPVTVPSGSETGLWEAYVYRDRYHQGTPLATFGLSVVGTTITMALSSLIVAGLAPLDSARFTGHWELSRTVSSAKRTWLKGDFVIDANRSTPGNGMQAVAVTLDDAVVEVSSTAVTGVDQAQLDAAIEAHRVDTTNVHGVLDTVDLSVAYLHTQGAPALTWNVSHGLNRRPVVAVLDSTYREIDAQVDHTDLNNLVVTLLLPLTGYVPCR